MRLSDGTLTVEGRAPVSWIGTLASTAENIPGIDRVESSRLGIDYASLLVQLRALLEPPSTATLALEGSVLKIAGEAPKAWLEALIASPSLPGVESIDHSALVISERLAMETIAREINAAAINFDQPDVTLSAAERDTVARLARELQRYAVLGGQLGLVPHLTLTGHSDESGTVPSNIALEQRRAEYLAAEFRKAGVDAGWITTKSQLAAQESGARTRQVTLQLEALASNVFANQD